jgi:hypothetical protein
MTLYDNLSLTPTRRAWKESLGRDLTEAELDEAMASMDFDGSGEVDLGLGCIVALYYRSSTLYQIR